MKILKSIAFILTLTFSAMAGMTVAEAQQYPVQLAANDCGPRCTAWCHNGEGNWVLCYLGAGTGYLTCVAACEAEG